MKVRTLTTTGIEKFSEYLDILEQEPKRLPPSDLLDAPAHSRVLGKPTEIEPRQFSDRQTAAQYLDHTLGCTGVPELDRNVGLWVWLTLFYFDEVCPPNKSGERFLRERAAYVPEPSNYQRYYRHLLLGPCLIYRAHRDDPERAIALMCKPLHIIDDIVGQLAARQEFVTNPSVVELATQLYFDPSTRRIKKGAGGKGGGSPRRLADVLWQFDVTWDLYATTISEFLVLLPKEFDRFRTVAR